MPHDIESYRDGLEKGRNQVARLMAELYREYDNPPLTKELRDRVERTLRRCGIKDIK